MSDMGKATVAEVTGKIMVVAVIILFLIVIFFMFLHLYAKWFWWQTHQQQTETEQDNSHTFTNQQRPRRHRFVFTPELRPGHVHEKLGRGLDPFILKSMPALVFNRPSDGVVQECVVCLCQLAQGDEVRMLHECSHVFHVECIDMWFQSHSTCPLCRNTLKPDHRQTTSPNEMMAIQSRNASESLSTVSLSVTSVLMSSENEEHKAVAVAARIGSVKRMLSTDQKVVDSSSSSVADLEQGMN